MDNEFLKGLEQIKKASPKLVVETIFQLFHSIGSMDVNELVAAKRTFDLFRSLNVIGEPENKILDQIDGSMITRARVLCGSVACGTGPGLDPTETHIPLNSVFGDKC